MMALDKPKIPTEIKKEAQMSLTNVSKILRAFKKKGLVICLTPDSKTGKIYELTNKGKGIREKMTKNRMNRFLTQKEFKKHRKSS